MPRRNAPKPDDFLSDYNIFGYDPEGRLAHIVAHYYGPAWLPQSFTHLWRFEGEAVGPPRYGPLAPHQIPWLPSDYKLRPPPLYHGAPKPPYLPGPIIFHPKNFAAMLYRDPAALQYSQPDTLLSNGFPVGEVAYRVWNIRVQYIRESRIREFGVLSNASWSDFHSAACVHLAVDPCQAQFAYYMSGEGYHSGLVSLKGKQEWENAMCTFSRGARQNHVLEFEILEINDACIKTNPKYVPSLADGDAFRKHAFRVLKLYDIDGRTHAFEYAKLETLFDALDPVVLLNGDERAMLHNLGIEYADNFTLISPLSLCLTTEILPEKVLFLYSWAERMISITHEEKRDVIEEMEGLRREWRMMRGSDGDGST